MTERRTSKIGRSPDEHLRVCAVIVTYNPGASLERNIEIVHRQVGGLIVVDNGSKFDIRRRLSSLESGNSIILIRNSENKGIAEALNQGIQRAKEQGFKWVLLLDQDSTCSEELVNASLLCFDESLDGKKVAVVAPTYLDRKTGQQIKSISANNELLYAMTSGSIVPIDVFEDVGYHDEALFIDYVDIEWCLRARLQGKKIIESKATLLHSLGNLKYRKFFWYDVPVLNNSPARAYYRERNRWHIYFSGQYDWAWFYRDVYLCLTSYVEILLWEEERWRKVKSISQGIFDAIRGRMGKVVDL